MSYNAKRLIITVFVVLAICLHIFFCDWSSNTETFFGSVPLGPRGGFGFYLSLVMGVIVPICLMGAAWCVKGLKDPGEREKTD